MKISRGQSFLFACLCFATFITPLSGATEASVPSPYLLASNWRMQDAARIEQAGSEISSSTYNATAWYPATVPGTVLTTLVNNRVYPEPLYGENNRPEKIPDSLSRKSYWYRTEFDVPRSYAGKHIWVNFAGINYSAAVWVNGSQVGTMRGAFARGMFDVSSHVKAGKRAVMAVLITPQPHPGIGHEHTLRDGLGLNGGVTAIDGPTFLSTIGWDWLPTIRDRDTGIWQKVFLSATGPVLIKDPLVTTDLPLPRLDSADIAVQTTVENISDQPQKGVLQGDIGELSFHASVELAPHSSQRIRFDPSNAPVLRVSHPTLWWPNGYGPQNLMKLHLSFQIDAIASDSRDVSFGIRKITYTVPDSDNLTLSVNGVRVFIRGGNWGLDEAMKRVPRERLEAQIRMHQLANLNMIRNWVGQSTSEDFYELCDQYGILLWDEFFQPNPSDGPNPVDLATYLANVREKIVRFRNHPSIAVWCARNEGYPPRDIDDPLRLLMAELEPVRLYQPSSTEGHGVHSDGPYFWRTPREFYNVREAFKTETGSVSIPTLESIQGMMPKQDWESINDDWAEHDLALGAQAGEVFPIVLASRYGKVSNLADFVRKSQMANYEAFRAMYEGRNAQLFHPTTGIITWMSNPAQPSFVWQLYHYDLEPNASLFAVKSASESIHIQLNEAKGQLEIVNNLPDPLTDANARITIYNLDGSIASQHQSEVTVPAASVLNVGAIVFPAALSPVHFIQLQLHTSGGKLISQNFYWRAQPERRDDLTDLEKLPEVALEARLERRDLNGRMLLTVSLHNPTSRMALMAHLQLRRQRTGDRVLPAYYSDNYLSFGPNETRTIIVEAELKSLGGETALVVLDGWNVKVIAASAPGAAIADNINAQVSHWPFTGLPIQTTGLRLAAVP